MNRIGSPMLELKTDSRGPGKSVTRSIDTETHGLVESCVTEFCC